MSGEPNAIVAETGPANKLDFLTQMDSLIPSHIPKNVTQFFDDLKARKREHFGQYQY